ncbi:hypothetical protein NFI96_023079 [Prochilodus magdalenae]|nr:hypothetical protein NFI96_023079 [Prochilodus magdalenae]
MRAAVLVAVSLCALVPLVHGYCFQSLLKKGARYCQDLTDKNWHAVGSTWTNSKCIKCSCDTSSMDCCDSMGKVIVSYPKYCAVEYDYTTCTYKVVKKKGYKGPCPHGAVG